MPGTPFSIYTEADAKRQGAEFYASWKRWQAYSTAQDIQAALRERRAVQRVERDRLKARHSLEMSTLKDRHAVELAALLEPPAADTDVSDLL